MSIYEALSTVGASAVDLSRSLAATHVGDIAKITHGTDGHVLEGASGTFTF